MIEKIYARYEQASLSLEAQAKQAATNPISERNINLGLVEVGDQYRVASEKISAAFAEMQWYLRRSSILEMSAAFEQLFLAKAPTAVGEARSALNQSYKIELLKAIRLTLLRETASFSSLDSIFETLKGHISQEDSGRLERVRVARNHVAHGVGQRLKDPNNVSPEEARDALLLAAAKLGL